MAYVLLQPALLKELVSYQTELGSASPITERAFYHLDELQHFLGVSTAIFNDRATIRQRRPGSRMELCVALLRQRQDKPIPGYYVTPMSEGAYSQVIPVMIPCIVDSACNPGDVCYLRDPAGNIPVFFPGGEGTGLIPPPPAFYDEDFG